MRNVERKCFKIGMLERINEQNHLEEPQNISQNCMGRDLLEVSH